jgi:hypothetical protein
MIGSPVSAVQNEPRRIAAVKQEPTLSAENAERMAPSKSPKPNRIAVAELLAIAIPIFVNAFGLLIRTIWKQ